MHYKYRVVVPMFNSLLLNIIANHCLLYRNPSKCYLKLQLRTLLVSGRMKFSVIPFQNSCDTLVYAEPLVIATMLDYNYNLEV